MLPVHVETSTCSATPLSDVVAILRVELGGQLTSDAVPSDAYRIAIECDSGDVVVIGVVAPGRARTAFETNLTGAPANVRARIVGLAIAEIVRELDRESFEPTPTPRRQAPDRAPPPAPPPSMRRDRPVRIGAFAHASSFHGDGAWLVGGGVRAELAYRRLCTGLDGAVMTTNERFDLGMARIVLGYGGPYIGWREEWGRVESRFGAGFALGAAAMQGHAGSPRALAGSVSGPWAAPYLLIAATATISGPLSADVRAQLGWVILPVVGEVARGDEIQLKGAWTSAQVGVTLAL